MNTICLRFQSLLEQRHQIEQHLTRTESWTEHLGQWRGHVQSVEYIEEQDLLQVTHCILIITICFGNFTTRPT